MDLLYYVTELTDPDAIWRELTRRDEEEMMEKWLREQEVERQKTSIPLGCQPQIKSTNGIKFPLVEKLTCRVWLREQEVERQKVHEDLLDPVKFWKKLELRDTKTMMKKWLIEQDTEWTRQEKESYRSDFPKSKKIYHVYDPQKVNRLLEDPDPSSKRVFSALETVSRFLKFVFTALILTACAVVTAGSDTGHTSQHRQGDNATIQFQVPFTTSVPTFIMYFETIGRPFAVNDRLHSEGLKDESQLERFNVQRSVSNNTLSVNLTIGSVTVFDDGVYVLKAAVRGSEGVFEITLKQTVNVYVSPGKANCYTKSSDLPDFKEICCHATCGNGDASLACFQDNRNAPYKGEISQDRIVVRGVFWMNPSTAISCCAYDVNQYVSQESCTDYQWVPESKITVQPENQPFRSTTGVADRAHYLTDSGSRGQNKFQVLGTLVISVLAQIIVQQLSAIGVAI